MDLLQLEHFLAVVEERTFTRAAERVCRTQPAVSQSIKKLEDEVGAPLFARDVHEVSLTEAGRVLADYARRMVNMRDEAMHQVSQLKALKAGTLGIAAHESAAVYLLPAPLRTYLRKFPDIRVGIYRSRLNEIPASGDGPRGGCRLRERRTGFPRAPVGGSPRRRDDLHRVAAASARRPRIGRRQGSQLRAVRAASSLRHHVGHDLPPLRSARRALPDRRRAVELREHQELRPGRGRDGHRAGRDGAAGVARRKARPHPASRAVHSTANADGLSRAGLRVGLRPRTDQDRSRVQLGARRSTSRPRAPGLVE